LIDEFHAGSGKDRMAGRGVYDSLHGDAGKVKMSGGAGRDLIVGGEGRDVMSGGLDRDTFRFDFLADSTVGLQRDVVRDFRKGADKIDLGLIDAHQYIDGDQAFIYIGQDPFTKPDPNAFSFGSAGQLRSFFNGTNTIVEGDVTGDAKADFQIALVGQVNLSVLDFVL
jgi:Ca2+-binding RTX toxin-like protein